jgi:hypothetical protein
VKEFIRRTPTIMEDYRSHLENLDMLSKKSLDT